MYFVLKILLSALIVATISELSKRNSSMAALLASLPLTSLLAFVWMKLDGVPSAQIGELSLQIFWLVIPSLLLFVLLWSLLRHGLAFWLALAVSCVATVLLYFALLPLLRKLGVQL